MTLLAAAFNVVAGTIPRGNPLPPAKDPLRQNGARCTKVHAFLTQLHFRSSYALQLDQIRQPLRL